MHHCLRKTPSVCFYLGFQHHFQKHHFQFFFTIVWHANYSIKDEIKHDLIFYTMKYSTNILVLT